MKNVNWFVVIAGVAVGLAAVVLTLLGNPANMGFCIACFERDIAGALSLHGAAAVQYVRPEIIGLVLGAFIMSLASNEFKAKTGSAPATRFVLGVLVMIGALVFLGCPLRMVIRLGGGDGSAIMGLAGFIVGIFIGVFFLNKGFSLKRAYNSDKTEGAMLPAVMTGLLLVFLVAPTLFKFSKAGPGSMHAPFFIALGIALVVGVLAQKARLCMVGGIRDVIIFKDYKLMYGFLAIFATVLVGNMALGKFHFAFSGQPIAHSAVIWNFLGMVIVGWGSVLLGGCPLRQLILAGTGNGDSAVTVFGMIGGAAIAHNFALAGGPDAVKAGVLKVGGISPTGQVAVFICLAVLLVISILNVQKEG